MDTQNQTEIFEQPPSELQKKISARLKKFKTEKKTPFRFHAEGDTLYIYLPGIKKRYFEFRGGKLFRGDWELFYEWLYGTKRPQFYDEEERELRSEVESNNVRLAKYGGNKLMHNDEYRAIVDILLTKRGIPVGKTMAGIDKEFQFAKAIVDTHGYEKAKLVVHKAAVDEYWSKDFLSLGFFFKKAGDSNIFDRISKSISI